MLTLKRASEHADLIEVVLHAHTSGAAKLRTDVNKVQHAVHTHRMAWLAEGQPVPWRARHRIPSQAIICGGWRCIIAGSTAANSATAMPIAALPRMADMTVA